MSIIGVRCVRGNLTMQDHLDCQRNAHGPPCGIAPTILAGMLRPKSDRVGVVFSPSSIQDCQRRHSLQKDHDWYLDVDKGYQMYRGDLFHAGLKEEPAPPGVLGVVRELRMHSPVSTSKGMQTFSGQADEVTLLSIEHVIHFVEPDEHLLHVRIVDWKTKNDIPHAMIEPSKRHVYQINEYGWLVERALLKYLKGWDGNEPDHLDAKLYLNEPIHFADITSVVVDELAIVYLSSQKVRTFSSETFLWTRGKMLGENTIGSDGKSHFKAFRPRKYEELELAPLPKWQSGYTEGVIREGIENQMAADEVLAAPLEGDDALLMCESCPVKQACYEIGLAQGYSMQWQRSYVEVS